MVYNKARAKLKHKIGRICIGVAFIACGTLFLIDMRIRPIIEKTCSYQSKILATNIINKAVYNEINSETADYSSLINVATDSSGRVTSIESNMVNINRLKTMITQNINESLKSLEEHDLSISLGTISGFEVFYGKGLLIPIKIMPQGYANAELVSKFSDAGINQTLHQITMKIEVDISAIIPGFTTSAEIVSDFVIAETIVVGNVPSSYTHIISGNSDLISDIASGKSSKLP